MRHIILCGDKRDTQIVRLLETLLSPSHTLFVLSDTQFRTVGTGEDVVELIETETLREISIKNAIVILKSNFKLYSIDSADRTTSLIVDAKDSAEVSSLAGYLPVYTCGFSPKDFITFSSRTKENTVVSLQRGLNFSDSTKREKVIEPFEIPCEISEEIPDYPILASILALILLGIIDENQAKKKGKIYFSYQSSLRTY